MTLREATDADADYFLTLRNDPATLRASRRAAITLDEHALWWARTSDLKYVALCESAYVGTLRVSADGTVSIVVDPACRGKGYGPMMLDAVIPAARAAGHRRLWAEVAAENVRSQRAFLKSDWRPVLFEKET